MTLRIKLRDSVKQALLSGKGFNCLLSLKTASNFKAIVWCFEHSIIATKKVASSKHYYIKSIAVVVKISLKLLFMSSLFDIM
jgi:hypothetical protein